jgi:anaerobic magnesium-protoporphyrin IX monomethyl ester cyclase
VYQANIKLALQMARLVKMIDPEIVVVFGGPQASFMPKEALRQMRQVDVIVRGEGENLWPELVRCIIANTDPARIKGIVFMRGDTAVETLPAPFVGDLDCLASPFGFKVFDLRQHETAVMLTSRGCCFNCAFCYTPRAFGRRIRMHSTGRVLADMSICVQARIKRRWKVEIWCETRTDLIDRPLLALMAKAGVKYIAYGLESVDLRVNKTLRKPIDLDQFEEIVKLTREAGIEPEVFTLYGLPGQSKESCYKTLDFLKRLKIKIAGNSAGQQLHLFFGTDIADAPARYGIRLLKKRRPLYLSPGIDFETKHMKRRDIAKVAKAYKAW